MSTADRAARADAERNRDKILSAAAPLLASQPEASMVQLAEAAGVGRATLYRHFASREEIVDAMRVRALDRAAEIIFAVRPADSGSPGQTLSQLMADLFKLRDPYRLIADQDPKYFTDAAERFADQINGLIAAAQEAGELTADVPVASVGWAFQGAMQGATNGMAAGQLTHAQALDLIQRSVMVGFAPR